MLKPIFLTALIGSAVLALAPSVGTAQVTATSAASASPAPSAAAPIGTPSPTPLASAAPLPSATPLPTPLALPPDASPQILAVQISDPVFHSGETVSGTVITSTNVAAVEVRLAGYSIRLPRTDAGVWQMSYVMPPVPFWLRRTYTAQVVALNTAGAQAVQNLTVSVR